jgi:curli biogenesis system outer membrane secretion channel CsgG
MLKCTCKQHLGHRTIMKTIFAAILSLSAVIASAQTADTLQLTNCVKPIASVMVGKLTCKSAGCGAGGGQASGASGLLALLAAAGHGGAGAVTGVGDGIQDMFVTALQKTGCFDLQDRESMDEIAKELKLAGKEVKTQQADFIISGALTTVEMENSSAGIGGGFIPFIGSISRNTQKANVGMDIKIIDVNTAKILDTQRHMATSEKSSFGVGAMGLGLGGGTPFGFGGSMSALKGTSLEIVAREAVIKAANGVVAVLQKSKESAVSTAQ